jgi:hypothetical protein
MPAFEYRQAQEVRDAFNRHDVGYLFIGKSGAILLGFPDTTQDADLFVERSQSNGLALVAALRQLGFDLTNEQTTEIERGKDFVQLKNGPCHLRHGISIIRITGFGNRTCLERVEPVWICFTSVVREPKKPRKSL